MAVPPWGLLVVILFPLAQVPAVLFVARYCEVDAGDLPTPPMRAQWRRDDETDDDVPGDVVRCGRCGALNEERYDHCRQCVRPLGRSA